MRLLNYTQNRLRFVEKTNLKTIRNGRFECKKENQLIIRETIEPHGTSALRVDYQPQFVGFCYGVPIEKEVLIDADPIPDGDDILIVSKQYAEACRRLCRPTHRLRVVCGPVYVEGVGHFPVACTGLSFVEACVPYSLPELLTGTFDLANGQSDLEGAIQYIKEKRHDMQLSNSLRFDKHVLGNPPFTAPTVTE